MSILATSVTSDLYIDQKVAEGIFKESLQERSTYRVLNIYGESGSGKSRFKEYIKDRCVTSRYITIELNFNNRVLHNPKNAIIHIAKELERRFDFNFLALWKAYTILWHKRFEKSLIIESNEFPYIGEIKRMVDGEKRSNSLLRVVKGLFKAPIAKELEELIDLDTQIVESRLYRFLASDLKNLIEQKGFKEFIFIVDSYELIGENQKFSPCNSDEWLKNLIFEMGKESLFLILSRDKIAWSNCNVTWKSQIKFQKLSKVSENGAKRYLKYHNIENIELQKAIIKTSALNPFWLSLAKYSYKNRVNRLPVVKKDILKSFLETQKDEVVKFLKILSHTRVFTRDLIDNISIHFNLEINNDTFFNELISFDFIKDIGDEKYTVDIVLKEELTSIEKDESRDYKTFLFNYYENILQSLNEELIRNSPKVVDEVLEEAWFYLKDINSEPLIQADWLDYHVSRFFIFAAWEPFIDRYKEIIPQLKERGEKVSKERLADIYNNLAGLYESIGEKRLAKSYYNRAVKINRLKLLSA